MINRRDLVFADLRLWQDKNHNGNVDTGELRTLSEMNLKEFDLDFKESKRVDQFGNEFRYKAKVTDTREGSGELSLIVRHVLPAGRLPPFPPFLPLACQLSCPASLASCILPSSRACVRRNVA